MPRTSPSPTSLLTRSLLLLKVGEEIIIEAKSNKNLAIMYRNEVLKDRTFSYTTLQIIEKGNSELQPAYRVRREA